MPGERSGGWFGRRFGRKPQGGKGNREQSHDLVPAIRESEGLEEPHDLVSVGGIETGMPQVDDEPKATPERLSEELTILTEKDEKPIESRMPLYPSQERMMAEHPDELVWLTNRAVHDRIRVFLQTNSHFSVDKNSLPSVAVSAWRETGAPPEQMGVRPFQATEYMAGNVGSQNKIPFEGAIDVLKGMGFYFTEQDGKEVMIIDATVPVRDNTDGKYHFGQPMYQQALGQEVQLTAVTSSAPERVGFRPPSRESTHGIAISVEEMRSMYAEPAPISVNYLSNEGWSPAARSCVTKTLVENPELFYRAKEIIGSVEWVETKHGNGSTRRKLADLPQGKVWELYQLFNQQGWDLHHVENGGYFPYEPYCHFEVNYTDKQNHVEASPFPLAEDDGRRFNMRPTAELSAHELANHIHWLVANYDKPTEIQPEAVYQDGSVEWHPVSY